MMKKWMKYGVVCIVTVLATQMACAQQNSDILRYDKYISDILRNHPIVSQSNIKLDIAQAKNLQAKGMQDPTIEANWVEKQFDKKQYYQQLGTNVKVPTRYGVDIVGGCDNTSGSYLNPEAKTDQNGLWHIGLEANLLQGLVTNPRSIALKQADLMSQLAKDEKRNILNKLIYDASKAYITWQQYTAYEIIYDENIELSQQYFDNTKETYFGGEKTAMDTLEAFIAYQDAIATQQKNELALTEAINQVNNYIWIGLQPGNIQPNIRPETYDETLATIVNTSTDATNHPIIQAARRQLDIIALEQRLKREKLKPKLKVKYNPLLATGSTIAPTFSWNDYKWGVDFSMPLFMRTERANVQLGKLKMVEKSMDVEIKTNAINLEYQNSIAQQTTLMEQITIINQNTLNYKRLLDGEQIKYDLGDSSMFLLNKRQEKYILNRLKLIETQKKLHIEILSSKYYSDQLL